MRRSSCLASTPKNRYVTNSRFFGVLLLSQIYANPCATLGRSHRPQTGGPVRHGLRLNNRYTGQWVWGRDLALCQSEGRFIGIQNKGNGQKNEE